jgi:hypothetical protein
MAYGLKVFSIKDYQNCLISKNSSLALTPNLLWGV